MTSSARNVRGPCSSILASCRKRVRSSNLSAAVFTSSTNCATSDSSGSSAILVLPFLSLCNEPLFVLASHVHVALEQIHSKETRQIEHVDKHVCQLHHQLVANFGSWKAKVPRSVFFAVFGQSPTTPALA